MKNFYIITWSLFFVGIVLKFLHITGANVLMLVSCVMLLIHSIIYLCKHVKTDYPKVLLYFSYTLLTIYVFGRICCFGFSKPVFWIALSCVIATLIVHLIKKKPFKVPQFMLVVYFVFFYVLSYTPSYKIHYVIKLNTVLNKERRDTDYYSWDKYSWFLHLRGLKEEALDANKKAQKAAELCIDDWEAQGYLEMIEYHRILILNERQIEYFEWEFRQID